MEATMNDVGTMPRHMLDVRELTAEAFAPYGQVVAPLRTGGQGAETGYDPETSAHEAKLVLGNGEPRLWIMHLPHAGRPVDKTARRNLARRAAFRPRRVPVLQSRKFRHEPPRFSRRAAIGGV